jgi:hypothetical protein
MSGDVNIIAEIDKHRWWLSNSIRNGGINPSRIFSMQN